MGICFKELEFVLRDFSVRRGGCLAWEAACLSDPAVGFDTAEGLLCDERGRI